MCTSWSVSTREYSDRSSPPVFMKHHFFVLRKTKDFLGLVRKSSRKNSSWNGCTKHSRFVSEVYCHSVNRLWRKILAEGSQSRSCSSLAFHLPRVVLMPLRAQHVEFLLDQTQTLLVACWQLRQVLNDRQFIMEISV